MKNLNRRNFMKMLGGVVAAWVVAPSVLAAVPKPLPEMPLRGSYIYSKERAKSLGYNVDNPIGIALENIPKDHFGWMWVGDMWIDAEKQQFNNVISK